MNASSFRLFGLCAAMGLFASWGHAKVSFEHQVFPILEKSCIKCHHPKTENGKTKPPKGGLRLDSAAGIMKGGTNGEVVVPGHPSKSPFYTLTILPEDHEDIMPSKGDVLKKKHTEILLKWIQEGAEFGSWHGAEPKPKFGWPVSAAVFQTPYAKALSDKGKGLGPLNDGERATLQAASFRAWPLAKESPWLDVDMRGMKSIPAGDWNALTSVGKRVAELDLGRSGINDAHLAHVAKCTGLMRLNLSGTHITAKGLTHLKGLTSLKTLNLHGTPLAKDTAALRTLRSYLPQTKLSGVITP